MSPTKTPSSTTGKWGDGTTDYHPPITWGNWYQHVNWLNAFLVIVIPIAGLVYSYWVPFQWQTAVFAVVYYFATGLGITAGYHRLWSHPSYNASLPLKVYLAAVGAGAVEGSIRWWSCQHRAHHRYTDTTKDPYSVNKGLAYSHLGWMILKQDPKRTGRTNISDLNEDHVVMWQHTHYLKCVFMMAIVLPIVVCGVGRGDWMGGFIYGGVLRYAFVQQATFCINSVAHWLGDQPFDDRNSPRDHAITALITLGEGYHNLHHEFPSDYRNAIKWYQYDPSKWMIWFWKQVGLASNLKKFDANEINKGLVQMSQKRLDTARSKLYWGLPLEQLPIIGWDDFIIECREGGKALVAIAGVIHDVGDFIKDHPGGKTLITSAIGKDATSFFNGGVYNHSNAAHNLLSTMRVAVLLGGCDVEIWRRTPFESTNWKYTGESTSKRATILPRPSANAHTT